MKAIFFINFISVIFLVREAQAHLGHVQQNSGHSHWIALISIILVIMLVILLYHIGKKVRAKKHTIKIENEAAVCRNIKK